MTDAPKHFAADGGLDIHSTAIVAPDGTMTWKQGFHSGPSTDPDGTQYIPLVPRRDAEMECAYHSDRFEQRHREAREANEKVDALQKEIEDLKEASK